MKVGHRANELSNEKMDKQKKNKNDKIDSAIMKKSFQQDKKDKEKVNKNKVEDMQASHELHVIKMIYVHGIQK